MTVPADYGGEIAADTSISGNGGDAVGISTDIVMVNGTWRSFGAPFNVLGDVWVESGSGPRLTIEDGVTVSFASGTELVVAQSNWGDLTVSGTSAGVVFTSASLAPSLGDWDGVTVHQYAASSSLTGLTVEYAGGNGEGGLRLNSSSPPLVGCEVSDSSTHGLYVTSDAAPAVSLSVFDDNALDGVRVTPTGRLSHTGSPTFLSNAGTGNGGFPMSVPADFVGEISADTIFAVNGIDAVEVTADEVVVSGTWRDFDTPLRVVGDVEVQSGGAPHLTIADGVVAEFDPGVPLRVGLNNWGDLSVNGDTDGVLFTSSQPVAAPGDWDGLTVHQYTTSSSITGLTVEYGGGNGQGGVVLTSTSVPLVDCAVTDSSTHGLYIDSGAFPAVSGSSFDDNTLDGVMVTVNGGLSHTGSPTFIDNQMAGNGGFPITTPGDFLVELGDDGTISGNAPDKVAVTADDATVTGSWRDLAVPYLFQGTVLIQAGAHPVVTVEDGVVAQFDPDVGLSAGPNNWAGLVVSGTVGGVLSTSSADAPAPGDWEGLTIDNYTSPATLVGLTVEYGGDNGYGNIYWRNAGGSITDSALEMSSACGLYRDNSNPTITGVTYSGNLGGTLY